MRHSEKRCFPFPVDERGETKEQVLSLSPLDFSEHAPCLLPPFALLVFRKPYAAFLGSMNLPLQFVMSRTLLAQPSRVIDMLISNSYSRSL